MKFKYTSVTVIAHGQFKVPSEVLEKSVERLIKFFESKLPAKVIEKAIARFLVKYSYSKTKVDEEIARLTNK